MMKTRQRQQHIWTLNTVLTEALKLLHPYMPFITEEIYCNLTDEESIMLANGQSSKKNGTSRLMRRL